MKINNKGIELIHGFEGLRLKAYQDIVGVWTIGWGNTFYEDNSKVCEGDQITRERADSLFLAILERFVKSAKKHIKRELNTNQFSAIVSFSYNLGTANLIRSTLLKKLNENPCNPTIRDEFLKWNKAGGKEVKGLTRRRMAEADLYYQ